MHTVQIVLFARANKILVKNSRNKKQHGYCSLGFQFFMWTQIYCTEASDVPLEYKQLEISASKYLIDSACYLIMWWLDGNEIGSAKEDEISSYADEKNFLLILTMQ